VQYGRILLKFWFGMVFAFFTGKMALMVRVFTIKDGLTIRRGVSKCLPDES
jgi:hypothetical protein